jgi:hypothetical protein
MTVNHHPNEVRQGQCVRDVGNLLIDNDYPFTLI